MTGLRLGLAAGLLAALAVTHGWAYLKGRSDCAAVHAVERLEAELAEVQRQRDAARRVADAERLRAEARARDLDAITERVDAYEEILARREPDAACRLDGDDAGWLRSIRQRPAGGP